LELWPPYIVGQDEEVLLDIERRAGGEEHVREDGVHEGVGVAAGTVQQEDGVVDMALRVVVRGAEGEVVQLELRQRLAGAEAEVGQGLGAVDCGPAAGGCELGVCGDA